VEAFTRGWLDGLALGKAGVARLWGVGQRLIRPCNYRPPLVEVAMLSTRILLLVVAICLFSLIQILDLFSPRA